MVGKEGIIGTLDADITPARRVVRIGCYLGDVATIGMDQDPTFRMTALAHGSYDFFSHNPLSNQLHFLVTSTARPTFISTSCLLLYFHSSVLHTQIRFPHLVAAKHLTAFPFQRDPAIFKDVGPVAQSKG
jgi:hypothetical protein